MFGSITTHLDRRTELKTRQVTNEVNRAAAAGVLYGPWGRSSLSLLPSGKHKTKSPPPSLTCTEQCGDLEPVLAMSVSL